MVQHTLTRMAEERNTDVLSMILEEISRENGNVKRAARNLGVVHSVLYYHLEKNEIAIKRCTSFITKGKTNGAN